jgi:O-antigen/teichoic acid export membrane protein
MTRPTFTLDRTALRTVISQFSWLFLSRIGGALLQAATLVIAARSAGVVEFGYLAAAIGVATVLAATSDMGVTNLAVKNRADGEPSLRTVDCLRLSNYTSIAAFGLSLIVVSALGSAVDSQLWGLLPLAVWVATEKSTEFLMGVAIADGDSKENLQSLLLRRAAILVGFALLLASGMNLILAFSTASAISGVGCLWAARRRIRPRIHGVPDTPMSNVIRESTPYWIGSATGQLRLLDVSVVSMVATPLTASVYAIPSRLTTPLRMIPTALAQIVLPYSARGGRGSGSVLAALVAGSAGVMGLVFIAALIWADDVVALLGANYAAAADPLRIVCGGLVLAGMTSVLNGILLGRDRSRYVAAVSTATSLGTLGLIAGGASVLGAEGAAYGLAIGFSLQAIALIPPTISALKDVDRTGPSGPRTVADPVPQDGHDR